MNSKTFFPRSECMSSSVPSRVGKVGMERRVPTLVKVWLMTAASSSIRLMLAKMPS
jgi:hypothetical protein